MEEVVQQGRQSGRVSPLPPSRVAAVHSPMKRPKAVVMGVAGGLHMYYASCRINFLVILCLLEELLSLECDCT